MSLYSIFFVINSNDASNLNKLQSKTNRYAIAKIKFLYNVLFV